MLALWSETAGAGMVKVGSALQWRITQQLRRLKKEKNKSLKSNKSARGDTKNKNKKPQPRSDL